MTALTFTLIEGNAVRGWIGSRVRSRNRYRQSRVESNPVNDSSNFRSGKGRAAMAHIDFVGDYSFTTAKVRSGPVQIVFTQFVTTGTIGVIQCLAVDNWIWDRIRSGRRCH